MTFIKGFIIIILILIQGMCSLAQQTRIDSLMSDLQKNHTTENLNEISYEYYQLGEPDSALKYGKLMLEQANLEADKIEIARANAKLGIANAMMAQYEKAIEHFDITYGIYKKLDNKEKMARSSKNLATIHFIKGDFAQSIEYFKISISLFESLGIDDSGLYGNLSSIYEQLGVYDKSLEYAIQSTKIAEKQNDKTDMAIGYSHVGDIYLKINDFENAELYFHKARVLFIDLNQETRLSDIYYRLGDTGAKQMDLNTAIEYYNKALDLKHNDKAGLIPTYIGMAEVFQLQNKHGEAANYLIKAEAIASEIDAKHYLAKVQSMLGMYWYKQKKNTLSKEKLNASNEIALQLNQLPEIVNNYLYLFKIDSIRGNCASSLKHFMMYESAKAKLINEKKQKSIAEMQTRYETERKEKEIELLKKDSIIMQNESMLHKQQKKAAFIGAGVLLFIILLLANRMSLRKKLYEHKEKQLKTEAKYRVEESLRKEEELKAIAEINKLNADRMQDELDHRNREITSSALYVAQKNEILGTIVNKLDDLKAFIKAENKKELNQLKRLIKENIELDDDWNNFKLHFEKVHPRFFETLTEKYPDLTSNEHKICAYLRMNLSGKEIARLLNITPKSTQMSRYRLKKKFNLGIDDDLMEFINSI